MKLDEIQKLVDSAVPGPWKQFHSYVSDTEGSGGMPYRIANCFVVTQDGPMLTEEVAEKNAEFIAVSRELVPKLLAVET